MADGPLNLLSLTGKHQIRPGDRLFSPINDLLIILSAITHAASLMVDGQTHKIRRPTMRLNTRHMGHAYVIPLRGPLEHALKNTTPDLLEIGITPLAAYDNRLHGAKLGDILGLMFDSNDELDRLGVPVL